MSLNIHGFVAWEHTNGTFNREAFEDAAQRVVLQHVGMFPGPNSVVLIDNASIHKSLWFISQVNMRGGIVVFTPPYCWDLTPLDNGAFGGVKRWLQQHGSYMTQLGMSTSQMLDQAFTHAIDQRWVPYFFDKCGY